jgi:DNA repair/transcription protein MET18/MMS19
VEVTAWVPYTRLIRASTAACSESAQSPLVAAAANAIVDSTAAASAAVRAAADAMASVVHKHGKSGCLGAASGLATAKAAGLMRALDSAAGVAAAGGMLRALAACADPAAAALAADLVSALSSPSSSPPVAAGAARALGVAMAPGGGGQGLTRACHGAEKVIFRQRLFAQTLPAILAPLAPFSSSFSSSAFSGAQRPAHLSALIHLARHAPIAAVLQAGDAVLPLLPAAMSTLSESAPAPAAAAAAESAAFADRDALAAAIVLTAAFLADPRGRDALARHAEEHAVGGCVIQVECS